jgi:uncharacterized hydrophobic protein (TIGR00271 family)
MHNSPILLTSQDLFDNLSSADQDLLKEETQSVLLVKDGLSLEKYKSEDVLLLLLDDQQFIDHLEGFLSCRAQFVVLPNKNTVLLMNYFGVTGSIKDQLERMKSSDESVEIEMLYCNEIPVLDFAAIGETITFLTGKPKRSLKGIYRDFRSFWKRSNDIRAQLFTIQMVDKQPIELAATDILVIQHTRNDVLSGIQVEESFINDGMFNVLLFAPRSIAEVFIIYFKRWWPFNMGNRELSNIVGLIRDESLTIASNQEFKWVADRNMYTGNKLSLSIRKGLRVLPGKLLRYQQKETTTKAIQRLGILPQDQVKKDLVSKRLPWIRHASSEEYRELFAVIRENAKTKESFLVLMMLSTILATFGLFSNSSPVIIGAMILAPLMSPIISLSLGVLRQDHEITKNSLKTIGYGVAVAYFFAIGLTIITPLTHLNEEISARTNPNIIDLGVAIVSGVAGAYAHAREEVAKTLAGVAIAVALVPPLAVSGIGIGWGDWSVFFGSFLLLLTNLTGMVLAGALTFLIVGFSPYRLARKGLLITAFVVTSLSIPLGYGFVRLVQENRIIESVNHMLIHDAEVKDVRVLNYNPLTLSVTVVSDQQPETEIIDAVRDAIELRLEQPVIVEMNFSIRK